VGRSGDFGAYRVLVVSQLSPVDDELAGKLVRYVRDGGTLVWHPASGVKNMETAIYPERLHPALHELFGVNVREYATSEAKEPVRFQYRGKTYNGGLFYDLVVLQGAEAQAEYVGTWFAPVPAVTVRAVGRGKAYYVGTFAEERFYGDFLWDMCSEVGVSPTMDAPVNELVEIVERSSPDGRRLLFLLSYSDQEQFVDLPAVMDDVWNDETVSGRCRLSPHGVRVLRMQNALRPAEALLISRSASSRTGGQTRSRACRKFASSPGM
jgi:beta-galactosidase